MGTLWFDYFIDRNGYSDVVERPIRWCIAVDKI
jgi:hypothetical protein